MSEKIGLVYFLKADFSPIFELFPFNENISLNRIKVGKSSTVTERKKNLSIGSPVDLLLLRSYPHYKYSKFEKYVHCAFQYYKVEGKNEWFDVSDDILECILLGSNDDLLELFESLCGLSFEEYCRLVPLAYK